MSLASVFKENERRIRIINQLRHAINGRRRNNGGIRGICHSIHRYAKANNKYMKDYNEDIESSYIQYLHANNLYGLAMSQKLPKHNFKWVEDTSVINEEFIKTYNENSYKGYTLEVDVKYLK